VLGLLLLGGVISTLIGCASAAPPPTPLTADDVMAQVTLSASSGTPSLVATGAIADFGIEQGIRLVTVRIVDRMQIDVHVASSLDVTFAEAPRLCLVGPYSAPDDGGLQDPCWGSPDLSAALAGRLPTSADGRPMILVGQAIDLSVALERGDVRCDYAPGQWTLEFDARPLVDGQAPSQGVYAPAAQFSVPVPGGNQPLRYLGVASTHYCGLATPIYLDQGEPATLAPQ
jgi:hypothetical protein